MKDHPNLTTFGFILFLAQNAFERSLENNKKVQKITFLISTPIIYQPQHRVIFFTPFLTR